MNNRLRILTAFAAATFSLCAVAHVLTPVHGAGEGHAISQNQFQSTGVLRVGQDDLPVTSVATVLALGPGPGHSLVGLTTHTLDFGNGDTMTTSDEGRLEPVDNAGLYQLLIKGVVTGGTGRFAGSSGKVMFTGRVNLATGSLQWRLNGSVD